MVTKMCPVRIVLLGRRGRVTSCALVMMWRSNEGSNLKLQPEGLKTRDLEDSI